MSSSSSSTPLYTKALLSKEVEFKFTELNVLSLDDFEEKLQEHVLHKIQQSVEGKCIEDGYVKKGSVRLHSLSCGLYQADKIKYTASYECLVCLPVEDMRIHCVVVSNSNGGVRAVIEGEEISPIVVFVSRDLPSEKDLSTFVEGQTFDAVVYGVQYELNDPFVAVLAKPV